MSSRDEADKMMAETMMYLIQTAANDGIITQEEKNLLDTFEYSMKHYKNALNEALEDGKITEKEEEKLTRIKEVIISGGRIIADEIDGISKDEMNLLIAVMVSLKIPKKDISDILDIPK